MLANDLRTHMRAIQAGETRGISFTLLEGARLIRGRGVILTGVILNTSIFYAEYF